MAIRIIRENGDPVLRKEARVVESVNDKIKILVDDMVETMYDADGVGLAAPQIGILKRIIVVDVYDETGVKVLINPEIVEMSGEQIGIEGCLSVPGESGDVKRPNYVKIKGLNRDGEEVVYEGTELLARAFCHEVDHLNGVLFIDKVIDEGDE